MVFGKHEARGLKSKNEVSPNGNNTYSRNACQPSIAVFVPIEDGHAGVDPNEEPDFGDAVKVAARIRELAPQYHQKDRESKFAAEDAKRIRKELSVEFATYKASLSLR